MRALLPLLLTLSIISPAFAEELPTCKDTPFPLLDNTIKFGTSKNETKTLLKKAFGSKIAIDEDKSNPILVVTFVKEHKSLESMVFFFTSGKMTRAMFAYSDKFMESLGGHVPTFKAVSQKIKDKIGAADNVDVSDKENGKAVLIWEQKGSSLRIIGQDKPYPSVQMRVDCNALETHLQNNAKNSANFGF